MALRNFAILGASACFGGAAGSLFSVHRDVWAYGETNPLLQPPSLPKGQVFDQKFRPFVLADVIPLARDVAIFRFLTPQETDEFRLPVCSTLQVCAKRGPSQGEQVTRFYTPITPNGTRGFFDFLVKRQPNGRMTEHLFTMKIGESILCRNIAYKLSYKPNEWAHIGLIGCGTGLTPLFQVLQEGLDNPADSTRMSLLYANYNPSKILLRGCLEAYAKAKPDRFQLHCTVDTTEGEEDWSGRVGLINQEMIQETMPSPSAQHKILVCGSDALMNSVCGTAVGTLKAMSGGHASQGSAVHINNLGALGGMLRDLGYTSDMVYRF